MGDTPHSSSANARQTRRMWKASVIVAILLVVSGGWILFYDGPPPDDAKMLPQWTQQDPAKPNPLAVFMGEVDSASFAGYEKLSPHAKELRPGSEPELHIYLATQQANCDAFDKLMLTDIRSWLWPDGEKLAEPGNAWTNVGDFGAMAQMLRLRIHILKVEGKIEEAVALSLDLSRFGAGLQSAEGMLIHSLVGATFQRMGEDALRDTLVDAPASQELLRKTLREMETIPSTARKGMQFAYKAEYLTFKNMTERMGHGQLLKALSTTPSSTVVRDQLTALFFKRNRTLATRLDLDLPVVEALDRSWMEAYAAGLRAGEFSSDHAVNKGRISSYLDPNFGGTSLVALGVELSDRMIGRAMSGDALKGQTEIMLALRLFELEKDRLPAKLDELVPDYLASIPEDVFTGKPMHWNAAQETTYSVGGNGVDDGGRIDPKRPHKGLDVGMRYWWSKLPDAPAAPTNP